MSRTAYPTLNNGDAWTASQANTFWRDNDLQYWPYTTAGDLKYATSNSTSSRLPIGTKYQTLITNAGATAPQWFTMLPAVALAKSGSQSLGSGAETAVLFDVETIDALGWHSTVSNTSRVTPTITGYYIAVCYGSFTDIGGSGDFQYTTAARKNGSTNLAYNREFAEQNAFSKLLQVTSRITGMNGTTDYIEMTMEQNTGDTLNIGSDTTLGVFMVQPA